jgi:phospholipid N-methyltransferase
VIHARHPRHRRWPADQLPGTPDRARPASRRGEAPALGAQAVLCGLTVLLAQHVRKVTIPPPRAARRGVLLQVLAHDPARAGAGWGCGPGPARAVLDLAGGRLRTAVRVEEVGAGTGAAARLILERVSPASLVDVYEPAGRRHQHLRRQFAGSDRLRLHYDPADMGAVLGDERADVLVLPCPAPRAGAAQDRQMMELARRFLGPSGVVLAIEYSRRREPLFRRYFRSIQHVRYGRLRWPVLYRLEGPRTEPDAA